MHNLFRCVGVFQTPWTVAQEAPLSVGFSRQEHWSGLPCPPPGVFPIQDWTYSSSGSCIAGEFFIAEALGKPLRAYAHNKEK